MTTRKAGLYFTIGESSAGRLPAARERLHDDFYVPLADLTKLGKDEMQRRDDIAKLYSQSSGLAAFLLEWRGGPLSRAAGALSASRLRRRDNDQTLAEATGSSYRSWMPRIAGSWRACRKKAVALSWNDVPAIRPDELAACSHSVPTVAIVQLVRTPDCGSGGRGFESH